MSNVQTLIRKWGPVLNVEGAEPIKDSYRKATLAIMLENQERDNVMASQQMAMLGGGMLAETVHANSVSGGGVENWNPILISLVRRSMPNLIAYDTLGVQPMTGPTGLIFCLRSKYTSQGGTEAFYNEADTDFSGHGLHAGEPSSTVSAGGTNDVGTVNSSLDGAATWDTVADAFGVGDAMSTALGEDIGDTGAKVLNQMAFQIERSQVLAKTRALKAEYTMELAQDLKAIHGLDAEAELANILSGEILTEINREIIRKINLKAKLGATTTNVANQGVFDLSTDADGRWSVEKFKGLLFQISRECNQIAKDTRRGKGNFILCSSDVASALEASGVMDYAPEMKTNGLNIDDTGNTFVGTINGRLKVYIDPYSSTVDYVTVGFRGKNAYDAGMFYCPYVPLTMVRAIDQDTFQPKIGFKTRYGLVAHPFAGGTAAAADDEGTNRANVYYRIFRVDNILQ